MREKACSTSGVRCVGVSRLVYLLSERFFRALPPTFDVRVEGFCFFITLEGIRVVIALGKHSLFSSPWKAFAFSHRAASASPLPFMLTSTKGVFFLFCRCPIPYIYTLHITTCLHAFFLGGGGRGVYSLSLSCMAEVV